MKERLIPSSVVFVHGFTGHPEKTWTLPGGRGVATTYWPRDKVPQSIPAARVWTFGYDTEFNHPFRSGSQNTIYGEGKELVASLADVRLDSENKLPIIFIAHSLGGILVKQALRYSEKCKSQPANRTLGSIFDSVTGILFFGTPHGGADPRDLNHHILQNLAGMLGVKANPNTIATLLPNSAELEQLRDEFLPMVRRSQWAIFSFQEQRGIPFLNGKLVVEKASSCLGDTDIENTRAIDRNHIDMCKFSQEDSEYRKVDQALRHIWKCSTTQSQVSARWISEDQGRIFLSTLWWPAMNSRENAIEDPSIETVQWIFDKRVSNNQLSMWLESSEPLFWIRGKAGCGKSTLMKFLSHDQRTLKLLEKWRPSVVVLRFFFIEITTDMLERQLKGCFRSLLYQLLDSDRTLLYKILQSQPLLTKKASEHDWSARELQRTLINALRISDAAFCLFIDGLDEIQNEDQGLVVQSMEALANIRNVKICVSSREENALLGLRAYPSLRAQDLNHAGIIAYVRAELYPRLRSLADVQDRAFCFNAYYLVKTLVDKAGGIFLWIQLVVRSLLRGIDNGDSFHTLWERTDEFAPSLERLFRQMWSRQNPDHDLYRQESAKLFSLALDVYHEPDLWRTTFIGNLFLTNIPIRNNIMGLLCDGQKPTVQYIQSVMKKHEKWLLARSAGLLEVQSCVSSFLEREADNILALPMPKEWEVRLIHKSAREYLLNTHSGRAIMDHDTRQLQDKWLDVIDALRATAIFSIVYKINIFNDVQGVPSLLPENITTITFSSFTGLLACHTVMGHISTEHELTLLNDFAEIVRAIAHPRKLQFPILNCAAAYGTRNYLSQNCGQLVGKLTADERNTVLFSACASFQIHVRLSQDIPFDWENSMDIQEWNIFAIKMIRRSLGTIKYMLLAGADADAIFSSRVEGLPRSTAPFLTFLRQLFISISDLGRNDGYYPNGLWESEVYADELKGLYVEIGACIDIFTTRSKPGSRVILDDRDYGHFCMITKPRYQNPRNAFEVSVEWFVEFFQARRAFFENPSQSWESPGTHGRSQYVKCIALGLPSSKLDRLRGGEALGLEEAFEALLWNRASWQYRMGRLFPGQARELDRRFESSRDAVLDVIYS